MIFSLATLRILKIAWGSFRFLAQSPGPATPVSVFHIFQSVCESGCLYSLLVSEVSLTGPTVCGGVRVGALVK